MDKNIIVKFALDIKSKFPIDRDRRFSSKNIWIEIDKLTKEYLNKKEE